jgi:hypothetical protein
MIDCYARRFTADTADFGLITGRPRHLAKFARYWMSGPYRGRGSSRMAAKVWTGWSLPEGRSLCRTGGRCYLSRPGPAADQDDAQQHRTSNQRQPGEHPH